MISIVMATYNGEKYIDEQLHSFVCQSKLPDEILIADDCSNDNTVSIINNFIQECNIKYPSISIHLTINCENKGFVKNFQTAILESKGDIVFLSDQDDIWKFDKIEKMSEFILKNKALVIHSDINIISERGSTLKTKWENYKFKYRKNIGKTFFKKLNYCGMALAFNGNYIRNCLKASININVPTHDWAICAYADFLDGFWQMGEVFTLRRVHSNNVALRIDSKNMRGGVAERLLLLKKYLLYYEKYKELLVLLQPNNTSKKEIVDVMISFTRKRIEAVKNRNLIEIAALITNIKNYPSLRAYIGDVLYVIGAKKLIKKYLH